MLSRRGLLAAGWASSGVGRAATLPTPPAGTPLAGTPPVDPLAFAILRNGTRIGTQRVEFEQAGGSLIIRSQAELRVLVLSIPVFHYTMEVVEHWAAGNFLEAMSRVDDNGARRSVSARRQAGFVAVRRSGAAAYRASADALPFTHWNKAALQGPLIDMATGDVHRPRVAALGWYRLPTLPAGGILARRYQLSGALTLSDFYDLRQVWVGQEYRHRGHIIYERIRT